MKKIKAIFILILMSPLNMMAQDYQTVKSDRIAFFDNIYGSVKCIRIDSVEFNTDSIFYPFSNIQQIEGDCFTPYGASWIGYKIITQRFGFNIFLNNEHDTIKIKTNSILNENWIAYIFPDSSTVIATLINLDTLRLFDQLDSAKTIGFQVYDKNLNPVTHKLNTMSIIISKNYGLVKTFNFSLFPDFEASYFNDDQFQEYRLIGLSKPKIGIQNLSWYDVNDFQVGDEIHVSYESSTWWFPEEILTNSKKTIFKYLSRTDYNDSIVYLVEIVQSLKNTAGSNVSFIFLHDTIESIIKPKPTFEKLPGEIIFSDNEVYSLSMNNNTFISKTEPSIYTTYYHAFDSCWSNCCADGCFTADTYIKGLGGPYYECTNFDAGGGIENKLVYYKKGTDIWGTPFVITSVNDNCIEKEAEIYPNPAKNIIFINIQNLVFPVVLELSDIAGQILSANELNSGASTVNIENLKPGIYIYRFSKNGEMIKTGKLIVE